MTMTEGQPVGAEQQIVEAFSLGSTLATIGTDVRHLVSGVEELKGSLRGAVDEIGRLKGDSIRHDEQLKTLFNWKREVETATEPEYVTKVDFEQLRSDIQGSRLTWPKLIAGLAALGGVLIAAGSLLLAVAENLGVFSR